MNRRQFHLLGGSSAVALVTGLGSSRPANAASAAQAALLKTTLTPTGAERAGNADGSIPAWTGGETTPPPGWTAGQQMPDIYASDKVVVSINAANMSQYKDKLSDGVMAMMQKYPEFRIDVYPTRRSAAHPQWVYDNTYLNATRTQANPGGARLGFSNGYGGVPFPIPDQSDPLEAGAQVIQNHLNRWRGSWASSTQAAYVMQAGSLTLTGGTNFWFESPYYDPNGTLATFTGYVQRVKAVFIAPANQAGLALLQYVTPNPLQQPIETWEYLVGQGRVRKAPELQYDTPTPGTGGIGNYDETYIINQSPDRYDWKLIGKKEIYIPYNNNKLMLSDPAVAHLPHSLNPDLVRWELHRVWVLDATLHPGDRDVVARRRVYVEEDSWNAMLGDEYDGDGNLWKVTKQFVQVCPDLPGTVTANSIVYDLQADKYCSLGGAWGVSPYNQPFNWTPIPGELYEPQSLAAQAAY